MSYNTYWSGDLTFTPPLDPADVNVLEDWLKINETKPIEDEHLDELLKNNGYNFSAGYVYNIFDSIDCEGMTAAGEGSYPPVIAVLVYRLNAIVKQMGSEVTGELIWSGDETDDLGRIIVRQGPQQTEVWICDAILTHSDPGSEGSWMISGDL
jgi:hypothetical protein